MTVSGTIRWIVVIAALGAVGYFGWQRFYGGNPASSANNAQKSVPPAVRVTIAPVQKTDFPVYLTGLGTVQGFNTVLVRTRVDGQIDKIAFQEGQLVKQGDLLAEIDPRPFQAALDQAKATRQSTEAALALARQKEEDAVIRSPITGVVDQRKTNPGERLGEAGVAFVIVQTAPLKLRFSIPERYLSELRTGQTIIARVDPYPDEKFAGRIKTVGGVIDPATRTFFAEAEFPNSDGRLRPGLFARIELGAEDSHAKAR